MEQLTVAKTKTLFKLKYSTTIRVWHWLTFLLMIASMVTVLFASTLFEHDGGKPSDKGQEQRTEQQGEEHTFNPSKLDPEAKAACTYSNKIWDAHKIIGFGLCFLLLSRVFINIRLEVNNNQLHFTVKNK